MKEIETSKGSFVVVEVLNNVVFCLKFNYYGKDKYEAMFDNSENNFSYEKCFKLSEITEEEAISIVDSNDDYGVIMYQNYRTTSMQYFDEQITVIQSLYSLFESQGIEITNNTYIFKV